MSRSPIVFAAAADATRGAPDGLDGLDGLDDRGDQQIPGSRGPFAEDFRTPLPLLGASGAGTAAR
jgi:hypothetical protein